MVRTNKDIKIELITSGTRIASIKSDQIVFITLYGFENIPVSLPMYTHTQL